MEAVERLHAEDYQLITPGGRAVSKAEYLDMVGSDGFRYIVFEPVSALEVRLHDDVAIARYQARIEVRDADGDVDAGIFWHTDVWERRDDGWRAVWSHATRTRSAA
jgi:ketosteroid isomerase-like protein